MQISLILSLAYSLPVPTFAPTNAVIDGVLNKGIGLATDIIGTVGDHVVDTIATGGLGVTGQAAEGLIGQVLATKSQILGSVLGQGGVTGGITGGVTGGINGGINGGVTGGINGGINGGITGGVKVKGTGSYKTVPVPVSRQQIPGGYQTTSAPVVQPQPVPVSRQEGAYKAVPPPVEPQPAPAPRQEGG